MCGCRISIANFFSGCQELIVQSVDLARLIGRDILLMQGSQLMLGWLAVVTIANRPRSLVNWRGAFRGAVGAPSAMVNIARIAQTRMARRDLLAIIAILRTERGAIKPTERRPWLAWVHEAKNRDQC